MMLGLRHLLRWPVSGVFTEILEFIISIEDNETRMDVAAYDREVFEWVLVCGTVAGIRPNALHALKGFS